MTRLELKNAEGLDSGTGILTHLYDKTRLFIHLINDQISEKKMGRNPTAHLGEVG
jgi:hypothetical protein